MSRQHFSLQRFIAGRHTLPTQLRHRRVLGFSLIELMISMAIALLLILGLVTLVGNMQRTYATQTDTVGVSDKERFAGALFGYAIETSGYYTVPSPVTFQLPNPIVTWLPASTPIGSSPTLSATYVAGQVVAGTTGTGTAPDTLSVRFQSNSGDAANNSNCLGGIVPAATASATYAAVYESVFSINTTTNQLQCTVYTTLTTTNTTVTPNTSTTATSAGATTTLIDGVSNMKVLYGVDVSGSSTTGSVTQYYSASTMPSANWINVRSIQIVLTFASTNNLSTSANSAAAAQTYTQTYQVMYAVP
jgi:type IV pilus assembly protein PilW